MPSAEKYYPQFFPRGTNTRFDALEIPFTADISISLVKDGAGDFQLYYKKQLEESGKTPEDLLFEAIYYLKYDKVLPKIEYHQDTSGIKAEWYVRDQFDAARILLSSIQQDLKKELGDNYFFGIPSIGFITCWSSDSMTEEIQEEIEETCSDELFYVSPKVYRWSDVLINFEH